MADAQTPVLTDEQIDVIIYEQYPNFDEAHDGASLDDVRAMIRSALAAQAPAQLASNLSRGLREIQFGGCPTCGRQDCIAGSHGSPAGWPPRELAEAMGNHPAPSHPDRAVMQQALDALRDLEAMAARYRPSGYPVPDAQKKARAAIAALSATMEKPNG